MGAQDSICSLSTSSALETDASNTIEFDGERFILPAIINFDKQATFLKIESAARSFCQFNHVNTFYLPLVTRMVAYRHEKLFLAAWTKIKARERDDFLEELNSIQHDLMDSFFHHYFKKERNAVKLAGRKSLKNGQVTPPKQYHPQQAEKQEDSKLGKQLLKDNKVAVVFMLAGYSTRFELEDKFLAPISLYEKVTILDLMFKRLKHNGANPKTISIAIICNDKNLNYIRKYLQNKDFFGFNSLNIKILSSFALPVFDQSGEYCFNEQVKLIKRSAGTANCAEQLFSTSTSEAWNGKMIEYVYFSGGENLLENPCDPSFLGRLLRTEAKAGIRCVKSQFFGELMPRLFAPTADSLKVLQCSHFDQLPSGTLQKLPIPMNSMVFRLSELAKVAQDYAANISLASNYQELKLEVQVFDFEQDKLIAKTCCNFEKDIRYLMAVIKNPLLYRVHRPDEYAPIYSKNKEYSFNEAVKFYRARLEKELIRLAS